MNAKTKIKLLVALAVPMSLAGSCRVPGLGEVHIVTPNGWVGFQEDPSAPISYTCLDDWACDDGRFSTWSVNDGFKAPVNPDPNASIRAPSFNDETLNPTS